VTPKNLYF